MIRNFSALFVSLSLTSVSCFQDNQNLANKADTSSAFSGAARIMENIIESWGSLSDIRKVTEGYHAFLSSRVPKELSEFLKGHYFKNFAPNELAGLDDANAAIVLGKQVKAG